MAAAIEWNLNHGQRSVKLFEIGRRYALNETNAVETPVLAIGATGEVRPQGLYDGTRDYLFANLKGDLDAIGGLCGGGRCGEGGAEWLEVGRRGGGFLDED